jgi:hypothetical protein
MFVFLTLPTGCCLNINGAKFAYQSIFLPGLKQYIMAFLEDRR